MNIILSVLNILLSPFSFFFLLLIPKELQDYFYEPTSVNTNRLKVFPFIIFISFYLLVCIEILYSFRLLVPSFEIWKVLIPTNYWLSVPCWFVTIITYKTYFKGMEGNIMGFIFFPMILVSSIALIAVNANSFFSSELIQLPAFECNNWVKFFLLGFSPLFVAMFSAQTPKEKNDDFFALVISNYIFQSMIFGVHWLVFKLFERNISFASYFGAGESILFYLPLFGGLLHYVYFTCINKKYIKKSMGYGTLHLAVTIISTLSLMLQLINYIVFLKRVW